jgi:hypothetical protein
MVSAGDAAEYRLLCDLPLELDPAINSTGFKTLPVHHRLVDVVNLVSEDLGRVKGNASSNGGDVHKLRKLSFILCYLVLFVWYCF